jgi:hypothetical protein
MIPLKMRIDFSGGLTTALSLQKEILHPIPQQAQPNKLDPNVPMMESVDASIKEIAINDMQITSSKHRFRGFPTPAAQRIPLVPHDATPETVSESHAMAQSCPVMLNVTNNSTHLNDGRNPSTCKAYQAPHIKINSTSEVLMNKEVSIRHACPSRTRLGT